MGARDNDPAICRSKRRRIVDSVADEQHRPWQSPHQIGLGARSALRQDFAGFQSHLEPVGGQAAIWNWVR
ncbi:hypothetical protein Sbs19_36810 [Sphingobium sp. BS19]|nr:hypothetical protein Sbs19_36810 [Sphingobium sp. BS19]